MISFQIVVLGFTCSFMLLNSALPRAVAGTALVTNTKDTGPGSLRSAVTFANAHPGTTVTFQIPRAALRGGVATIKLARALPVITANKTIIDGTTQTTFSGNTNPAGPEIVLDCSGAAETDYAVVDIRAADCALRGLVIQGFPNTGIMMSTPKAAGNRVTGCYVGTNAAGAAAVANGGGIAIVTGAHDNLIGGTTPAARNLVSGNSWIGIFINGPGTKHNTVQGNYVGLDASGAVALPNGNGGIFLSGGSEENLVGGTTVGAGNVISGNVSSGMCVCRGTKNNKVQGNFIGTDATGTAAVPNQGGGIHAHGLATGNLIGGTEAGARNVISGNKGAGIWISEAGTENNTVQGNYIGINAAGTAALANTSYGLGIFKQAESNLIGGAVAGAGNVISGNVRYGVLIFQAGANRNTVQGNFIGTDAAGTAALPNGEGGVGVHEGAQSNLIGGTAAGEGNTIAFNGSGVIIGSDKATANSIRGNSIFLNKRLGIDLQGGKQNECGETENDADDLDTGPNNLQNSPELTGAKMSGATTVVSGILQSLPNQTFAIDLFRSPAPGGSAGGCGKQGQFYVGSANVTTDSFSQGTFSFNVTDSPPDAIFTATATNLSTGDTSEFGKSIQVEAAQPGI
ncbi:MAG: hypothetical protein M3347_17730 [Armatimonadota bacterium]|nr:hypothetical protein [Armatimonadota bacterium]